MKLKNINIFITGGAGFIGSNIARRLLKEGANIRIYDDFSSGKKDNLENVLSKVDIINGDILNKVQLTESMKGADIVSHHAAQLEITKALKDPGIDLDINAKGTLNVLDACVTNKIKKLINASSACVYGQKDVVASKEEDATSPNWAYGVSKLAAEKYCQVYTDLYGLPVISFRYAIIYGENEWYGRVMTIFIKRALQDKPLVIFGTGLQRRDFTHVSDVAEANFHAITDRTLKNEVFNVSTGIGTTVKELANIIVGLPGRKVKIIVDTKVAEGEKSSYIDRMRLPSELQNMILANTKMESLLGYSPKVTLVDGIAKQMTWAENNLQRWKTLSY